jgi:hypothetical protein
VVNWASAPVAVPDAFLATRRKWYVVDGASPVTAAETALLALPLLVPSGVRDPYAVVVPYSNQYVVLSLLGDTVPFNVAVVPVTALAAPVVAAGGSASAVPAAAKLPSATQIAKNVRLTSTPPRPCYS